MFVKDTYPTNRNNTLLICVMLHAANDVLWQALQPGFHGIPREIAQNATAVAILTVAHGGFIVSGSIGTGILMRKKEDGTWSHPSACGLLGAGYGLLAGISVKQMIVFVQGNHGLQAITSEAGLQVGGCAEATLGFFGRTFELDVNLSNRGAGSSHAIAFSKGALVGVSAQGAVVGARLAANHKFYGVDVTPRQILLDDHAVSIPHQWRPLMDEVYAKLIALTSHYEDDNDNEDVDNGAPGYEQEKEGETVDHTTDENVETNDSSQESRAC